MTPTEKQKMLAGELYNAGDYVKGYSNTLYTFAIMHQVMNPGFAADVPYNVCQIDLAEGVRMVANITGVANDELRIGMALEAVFEQVGPGVSIPKFRPAG